MSEIVLLNRQALRTAMQLRKSLAISRESPVNSWDIATMLGLDVRFLDQKSLEGMYVRDPGLRIFLPSLKHRPRGRVLFSCAHEIGHHCFRHGTRVDEYLDREGAAVQANEELLADAFARHLLMPRAAVLAACVRRGWKPETLTSSDAFVLAGALGVGYETLVNHLSYSLELLSGVQRQRLLQARPIAIRQQLAGDLSVRGLTVVDLAWEHSSIDAECGEAIILPETVVVDCLLLRKEKLIENRVLYLACKPGTATVQINSKAVVVRVSRQFYTGPYANRYLHDPDEN